MKFIIILCLFLTACSMELNNENYISNDVTNKILVNTNIITKYPFPILKGTPDSWEYNCIGEVDTIYEDGIFKMWYRAGWASNSKIGYATSIDGIIWNKFAFPVVTDNVAYPCIIKIDTIYYLFVVNCKTDWLYRYSSLDGINWNLDITNLIPKCANAAIVYDKNLSIPWQMVYERWCNGFNLCYANSIDGTNWNYSISNMFTNTNWFSAWSGNPDIYKLNNYYYCLYGGTVNGWDIGLSRTSNFIDWEDCPTNPFIQPTLLWEGNDVADPSIVFNGTNTYIYYGGGQSVEGLIILSNNLLEVLYDKFN